MLGKYVMSSTFANITKIIILASKQLIAHIRANKSEILILMKWSYKKNYLVIKFFYKFFFNTLVKKYIFSVYSHA